MVMETGVLVKMSSCCKHLKKPGEYSRGVSLSGSSSGTCNNFSGRKLCQCSLPCSACLLVEYAENFGIETMAAENIREWRI